MPQLGKEFDDATDSHLLLVMGGQYGSEGKGEIVSHLARQTQNPLAVVRTGGPNAGHTVTIWDEGEEAKDGQGGKAPKQVGRIKMRHVPAGWVNPGAQLFLSPGGLIDEGVLYQELDDLTERWHWDGTFQIDQMAMKIQKEHRDWERENGLRARIGSTTEGIGAARVDKIRRSATLVRNSGIGALDFSEGSSLAITDVPEVLNDFLKDCYETEKGNILIESTQGFGLSLELSGNYPFVTSANITPGHLLGECGLSSTLYHDVLVVMRTYPIRVAGNSGPMANEITWEELSQRAPGRTPIGGERTTVTNLVRRIGEWDRKLAERMAMICHPSAIALTFLDYVFPELGDVVDPERIRDYPGVKDYLDSIEQDCDAPVAWVSTGPGRVSPVLA